MISKLMDKIDAPYKERKLDTAIKNNQGHTPAGNIIKERTIESIEPAHRRHYSTMEDIILNSDANIEIYDKVLPEHKDIESPIYDIVSSLYHQKEKRLNLAIVGLENARSKGLNATRMTCHLGALYHQVNEVDKAIFLVEEAREQSPTDPMHHAKLFNINKDLNVAPPVLRGLLERAIESVGEPENISFIEQLESLESDFTSFHPQTMNLLDND